MDVGHEVYGMKDILNIVITEKQLGLTMLDGMKHYQMFMFLL